MILGSLYNVQMYYCYVCVSNVPLQWEEFMKLGDDTDDKIVEDKITAQKPEDYCTLAYTVSQEHIMGKSLQLRLLCSWAESASTTKNRLGLARN